MSQIYIMTILSFFSTVPVSSFSCLIALVNTGSIRLNTRDGPM